MRSRLALVAAAVLVLGAALGGWLWWRQREAALDAGAEGAVSAYVAGWNAKDMTAVPFSDDGVAERFAEVVDDLGDAPVRVTSGGVARDGDAATTDLSVTWTLPGKVAWTYAVPARVVRSGERWVVGSPEQGSRWHPRAGTGRDVRARADLRHPGRPPRPVRRAAHAAGHRLRRAARPGQRHSCIRGGSGGGRRRRPGHVDRRAGQGHLVGVEGSDPGHHLPRGRLRPAPGPARGARRRHRPDVATAARPDPYVRAAVARHLRGGDGRDDREERRALRRRGPGRTQRSAGAVRLPARRRHRSDRDHERRHGALRAGADERHRRADHARPCRAGGGRDLAGGCRPGRARRTGRRRRADR